MHAATLPNVAAQPETAPKFPSWLLELPDTSPTSATAQPEVVPSWLLDQQVEPKPAAFVPALAALDELEYSIQRLRAGLLVFDTNSPKSLHMLETFNALLLGALDQEAQPLLALADALAQQAKGVGGVPLYGTLPR